MSDQIRIQDHCFKIEGTHFKITPKDGGGPVICWNLIEKFVTIEIDQTGSNVRVLDEGDHEFTLRVDYSMDKYEFCLDGPVPDDKPIAMVIGEANFECPAVEEKWQEPYFQIARAGDTFGLRISEINGLHVLHTYSNREVVNCGCIKRLDCYKKDTP